MRGSQLAPWRHWHCSWQPLPWVPGAQSSSQRQPRKPAAHTQAPVMGLHRAPFWHWHRLLQWGPQWSLSQPAREDRVRAEASPWTFFGMGAGNSLPLSTWLFPGWEAARHFWVEVLAFHNLYWLITKPPHNQTRREASFLKTSPSQGHSIPSKAPSLVLKLWNHKLFYLC